MPLVDDIKARLDIVEVVQDYVPLQKAGHNFKAACPFHTERTPSFFVFPQRQSWRCFGACATGGDVISFVQRKEDLDFTQTLHLLASRANVPIPERRPEKALEEEELLLKANRVAAEFYHQALYQPSGKEAMAYLRRRGLDQQTIDHFQLGYSPGAGALRQHLAAQGIPLNAAHTAGLLHRTDDGQFRDMFHQRAIFPIHDAQGRIIGFGGRTLDQAQPKYLNTPQTPLFDKSHTLYALHLAIATMRQSGVAVIVEGYMDVIAAHQHGFTNVVAAMGTALTAAQVSLLPRQILTVVQALDPDTAGQEATRRNLQASWRLLERRVALTARGGVTLMRRPQGPELKVALLPPGQDPDELIHSDPQAWQHLIQEALPWWEFYFRAEAARHDLSSPQGQAQLADTLFPVIAALENPYEQERLFTRLAQLLGVSQATLEASVGHPQPPRRTQRQEAKAPPTRASASAFRTAQSDPLEAFTLALLLQHPHLRERGTPLSADHFKRPDNREIFTHWLEFDTIGELQERIPETLLDNVNELLHLPFPDCDDAQRAQALGQCLSRLEERRLRELKLEEALVLGEQWTEHQLPHEVIQQQDLASNEALRQLFTGRQPESP